MQANNEEVNLVEIWLRRDPIRWIAGALGGLFAGAIAMAVAMLIAKTAGYEAWFPVKIPALILIGNAATATGPHTGMILTGLAIHEAVCLGLGVIYAHFTGTNKLIALLPMGLVWGLFSWIFISNLFSQSFHDVQTIHMLPSVTLAVDVVFGLSLASVAFFDRTIRGKNI